MLYVILGFYHVSWKVLSALLLDSQSGLVFMEQNIFWGEQHDSPRGWMAPWSQSNLSTWSKCVTKWFVCQFYSELCLCPPPVWAAGVGLQGQVWAGDWNRAGAILVQVLFSTNPRSSWIFHPNRKNPDAKLQTVCLIPTWHFWAWLQRPLATILAELQFLW